MYNPREKNVLKKRTNLQLRFSVCNWAKKGNDSFRARPEGGPGRGSARTAEPRGSARTKIQNPRTFRTAVRGADARGCMSDFDQTNNI
jgi:hypothetical protein